MIESDADVTIKDDVDVMIESDCMKIECDVDVIIEDDVGVIIESDKVMI